MAMLARVPDARVHVLLVGARIDVLTALVESFGAGELRVEIARDVEEAIALCRSALPEVVIADLSGLGSLPDVLRLLQGIPDIPLLVIADAGRWVTERASLNAGAYAFCSRPLRADLVQRLVEGARRGGVHAPAR